MLEDPHVILRHRVGCHNVLEAALRLALVDDVCTEDFVSRLHDGASSPHVALGI